MNTQGFTAEKNTPQSFYPLTVLFLARSFVWLKASDISPTLTDGSAPQKCVWKPRKGRSDRISLLEFFTEDLALTTWGFTRLPPAGGKGEQLKINNEINKGRHLDETDALSAGIKIIWISCRSVSLVSTLSGGDLVSCGATTNSWGYKMLQRCYTYHFWFLNQLVIKAREQM